jgi:hypothetical protein
MEFQMPDGQFPATEDQTFDILEFMTGALHGWGVFEDRFGRVKERFEVDAFGRWDGDTLVLEETFSYASGRTEQRIWKLSRDGAGSFTGRCADCDGTARGRFADGLATLDYVFLLKLKSRIVRLNFADRFYPVGDSSVVNRTQVSKWGIKVGEVSAVFSKVEALERAA